MRQGLAVRGHDNQGNLFLLMKLHVQAFEFNSFYDAIVAASQDLTKEPKLPCK